jgi:hypothetical protein
MPTTPFASAGSQRWFQVAVTNAPKLLDAALREAGAIARDDSVEWASPLQDDKFCEYRDGAAFAKIGINDLPNRSLSSFWPSRGPVWDGLGRSRAGKYILVEAKAHIPEAASPATQAKGESLVKIQAALVEARKHYAPKSTADWSGRLYQYANRLAFQYLLGELNKLPARVVFLDFYNATDMNGPTTIEEWKGATRLIHALLGLPEDLTAHGIHHAYVDVRKLHQAP